MSDDFDDKLKELELRRIQLKQQIAESAQVLDNIESKISDLKSRQQERMRADQRIDNSVLDNMRDARVRVEEKKVSDK